MFKYGKASNIVLKPWYSLILCNIRCRLYTETHIHVYYMCLRKYIYDILFVYIRVRLYVHTNNVYKCKHLFPYVSCVNVWISVCNLSECQEKFPLAWDRPAAAVHKRRHGTPRFGDAFDVVWYRQELRCIRPDCLDNRRFPSRTHFRKCHFDEDNLSAPLYEALC